MSDIKLKLRASLNEKKFLTYLVLIAEEIFVIQKKGVNNALAACDTVAL